MLRLPFRCLTLLAALALPAVAHAGWVIDWTTTATNSKGERMPSQTATQSIAGNRMRMEQPHVITIVDYGRDRFTMMNPEKQYFWSGSTADYVRDMTQARAKAMQERVASLSNLKKPDADQAAAVPTPRQVDPAKLPPVSITASGTSEQIAGYDAQKYEVHVDGQLFEEIWIAPLDLSADLDVERFLAQQRQTGAAMQGKSGDSYNALYHNAQYRELLAKSFPLKTITRHIAGSFERRADSVRQTEVPASAFEVPDSYRKVRLSDLLDPPPTPAPQS